MERVRPRGPLRRAAKALLYNPHHAPPLVPPPSRPAAEERTADDRRSILRAADVAPEPMHATMLSLPCRAVADWKKQLMDVLTSLFPAHFDVQQQRQRDSSPIDDELHQAAAAVSAQREGTGPPAAPPGRSCAGVDERVPDCCRKGFSSALLALVLPGLFHAHPPEHEHSGGQPPLPASSANPAGGLPRLIAVPQEAAEVLFDCPSPLSGSADSGCSSSAAPSPAAPLSPSPLAARLLRDMNELDVSESDEQRDAPHCNNAMDAACPAGSAFVHIFERYIAMAEDVCW